MTLKDLFFDTLRTLWAHKLRTFLTMFGIAWGIVSITLMVAAGEGLRVGQEKVSEGFGKNIMIIFAGKTGMQAGGQRAGRQLWWEAGDAEFVKESSPDCEYVMPELGQELKVASNYNSATLLVNGSYPEFAVIRSIGVGKGRYFNWEDERDARRVAFIGSDAKAQLFPHQEAIGETVVLRGVPYTIVGVMEEKEQDSSYDGRDVNKIFVPFASVLRDFPNAAPQPARSVDRLLVAPKSWDAHEDCKRQVQMALSRLHNFDPRDEEAAGIWDTVENAKAFRAMTDGMKYFLGGVGVTTLFLGGLGVMNVMLVAVRERTREIGVRKAVGATQKSILQQFFIETMIVVLISGASGLIIAFGLCFAVNLIPMPPFFAGMLPTWTSSLLSFALLGAIALSAAMYPAKRAAAVDPIVALRYEAGG